MKKKLENFTKLAFISLATLPLLKPNHNSIIIILCALLTSFYFFNTKTKKRFEFKNLTYLLPFFLFLCYELISKSYNLQTILLNLPYLIFPLLFIYKPNFINNKVRDKSFVVFQISVVIQTLLFFVTFLRKNSLRTLFNISKENIPFFREYVMNNYLFEIHPTYFSSYLLFSITISFFKFKESKIFYSLNILFSIFFIFLFSSRIIILLLFVTILSFVIYHFLLKGTKSKSLVIVSTIILLTGSFFLKSSFILNRFYEIKNEINKPVVGNYYNSTNTRVAIYKCDIFLTSDLPFWGYGNELQKELNICFAENNNSNFYKINVFNTHNYYYHLILYGGILFLLVFLFYFYSVFKNIKYSLLAVFLFFQFLSINLTENYLSRHYGLVLFCYFTSLFMFFKKERIDARVK
jgi:O-antigen ligase